MPKLYILRGLPGSGKTTLANEIVANSRYNTLHIEANQFFTEYSASSNGNTIRTEEYRFDRRLLGAAHDLCYGRVMHALFQGHDVVVANTFSTHREVMRYIHGVSRSKLDCSIAVVHCTYAGISPHDVPSAAVERMRDRWEEFAGEVTWEGLQDE